FTNPNIYQKGPKDPDDNKANIPVPSRMRQSERPENEGNGDIPDSSVLRESLEDIKAAKALEKLYQPPTEEDIRKIEGSLPPKKPNKPPTHQKFDNFGLPLIPGSENEKTTTNDHKIEEEIDDEILQARLSRFRDGD
ncbi:MAG: hypothetical protein WAM28_02890, partial [Chlamydiales bacterium]